jgi:hypothetical protein
MAARKKVIRSYDREFTRFFLTMRNLSDNTGHRKNVSTTLL